MATVYVASLRGLDRALVRMGVETERRVVKGLREAARFGHTAAVRTTRRTRDPHTIRASGSYENNWVKQDIPDGALLANAIFYAVFVERGRRKGRMPPLAPLIEWVKQKRIIGRRHGPVERGTNAKLGRERMRRAQQESYVAFARQVQRKIGRKGTKGRWVLRRTMPLITKYAAREVMRQLRDLSKNPPV